MSNENDDIDPSLQPDSQQAAPNGAIGAPSGPASDAPDAGPGPPAPNVGRPGAPEAATLAPWLRSGDGPVLQTDVAGLNICKSCQTPIPLGSRTCPRCKQFAPGNPGRPPRKADVDLKFNELREIYRGDDPNTKEFVYQLARAHVELRTVPLGSPEYKAITATAVDLVALLDRSRLQLTADTADRPNLDTIDSIDDAIARTTRALQMLTLLRRARAGDDDFYTPPEPGDPGYEEQEARDSRIVPPQPPIAADAGPIRQADVPTTAPAPEPRCAYGCGTLARCEEIKATRLDDWRALHYADPAEVERRQRKLTDEMLFQVAGIRPPRDNDPPPSAEERAAAERERAAAEVRRRLGWE